MAMSGAGPTAIFVSYRRADAGWPARWLTDLLARHFGVGVVFQDVDSIQPGDDFAAAIEAAVASCSVLLMVIGPQWLATEGDAGRRLDDPDDWVRLELEAAIERQIRIIPVLVDDAAMPAADELPSSLRELARRQAVKFSPAALDTRKLISVLEAAIRSGGKVPGQEGEEPAEPPVTRLVSVSPAVHDDKKASAGTEHPGLDRGEVSRASGEKPKVRGTASVAVPRILILGGYIAAAGIVAGIFAAIFALLPKNNGGLLTPPETSSTAMPQACTAAGPVVFVVSGRQDSPAPALTGHMETAAVNAINNGSPIGVVNLDGRPQLVFSGAFKGDFEMTDIVQIEKKTYFFKLAKTVSENRAKYPHADVLGALEVAGEAVRAACGHGGSIYLSDSGLQETGPLDFRNPALLASSPSRVVATLASAHNIPQLGGMTIVLVGIGDTTPPQSGLSIGQRANLINIWSAIARAGGAKVQIDSEPRGGNAPGRVPSVQLVPTH